MAFKSNINDLRLLKVEEVKELLSLKTNSDVLFLIKTGELPGIQLSPRKYRVKNSDLANYIESKRVQVAHL